QVQRAAPGRPRSLLQDVVREKTAAPYFFVYESQALQHHPAGTDVQVPDLGVADLPFRQADVASRSTQARERSRLRVTVENRGVGKRHGVARRRIRQAEAVEDHECCRSLLYGHA